MHKIAASETLWKELCERTWHKCPVKGFPFFCPLEKKRKEGEKRKKKKKRKKTKSIKIQNRHKHIWKSTPKTQETTVTNAIQKPTDTLSNYILS